MSVHHSSNLPSLVRGIRGNASADRGWGIALVEQSTDGVARCSEGDSRVRGGGGEIRWWHGGAWLRGIPSIGGGWDGIERVCLCREGKDVSGYAMRRRKGSNSLEGDEEFGPTWITPHDAPSVWCPSCI